MGMFGNLFGGAQCLLGFHDWKPWVYSSEGKCNQTRGCKRRGCTFVAKQVLHDWSKFDYIKDDSCEQIRTCSRCKASEKKMADHTFTSWFYFKERDCTIVRNCTRCKEREVDTSHQYGDWEYASPIVCIKEKKCKRCYDTVHSLSYEHQWGMWDYESPRSCVQVRFCRRCPLGRESKEPSKQDHNWGDPVRVSCLKGKVTCLRCPETAFFDISPADQEHAYGSWETSSTGKPMRVCRDCGKRDFRTV